MSLLHRELQLPALANLDLQYHRPPRVVSFFSQLCEKAALAALRNGSPGHQGARSLKPREAQPRWGRLPFDRGDMSGIYNYTAVVSTGTAAPRNDAIASQIRELMCGAWPRRRRSGL